MRHTGENVVRIEADALRALADRIAGPMANTFDRAVELMDACRGRVVVTGMGKSGIIARKIAATLSSIGTPALRAPGRRDSRRPRHGRIGATSSSLFSASGETEEILRLLATIKRLQVPLISMTGDSYLRWSGKQVLTHVERNFPLASRGRQHRTSTARSTKKPAPSAWRQQPRPPPMPRAG